MKWLYLIQPLPLPTFPPPNHLHPLDEMIFAENTLILMLEIFFHLEHIMGEPLGLQRGQGMQIDYGLQMWTTFQVYIKILTYFDPKSAQMRAQNDRLMREKKFFTWNTSRASQ